MGNSLKPIWLLDIDGVLNSNVRMRYGCDPSPEWDSSELIDTTATTLGVKFRLVAARPVIQFVTSVHENEWAEVRWHTTWQHDAQSVADALGLPIFQVQKAPEFTNWRDGSLEWWKLPAVRRVLEEEGRPVVWTDDDICGLSPRQADDLMSTGLGPILLIAPMCELGLTVEHLEQITDFLTEVEKR